MLYKILQEISGESGEICNFYSGKTILVTGAAGFLGSVLLEILLRCCPGIVRIYILLRSKKGVLAEERKNLIFKKEIFYKLKATNPDVLKKVVPITGDISQDNLGLNENDYNTLINEVSIVFHVAATVSFLKPLSFTVRQNVIATSNILELCRKLSNLEVFVYTSSAYSNCNQKDAIEEKIYDLPFSAEELLKFGRENNENGLMRLYRMCRPPFPNFYTFSKCASENLIKEKAYNLPVCIIRPSIIVNCLKEPLPGYVEEGSALINLGVGTGRGFLRVVQMDKEKRIEIIPADVTANAHIVGAFHQASKNLPSPSVYNCVTTELANFTWGEYCSNLVSMLRKKPLPHSYIYPMLITCKHPVSYSFLTLLLHYIPAMVLDLFLWISGSELKLTKMYQTYGKSLSKVTFFMTNEWNMQNKNFQSLSKSLSAEEEEIFSMDLTDFSYESITRTLPTGAPSYRLNGKPYEEKLYLRLLRYFLSFILVFILVGIPASVFYLVLCSIL